MRHPARLLLSVALTCRPAVVMLGAAYHSDALPLGVALDIAAPVSGTPTREGLALHRGALAAGGGWQMPEWWPERVSPVLSAFVKSSPGPISADSRSVPPRSVRA